MRARTGDNAIRAISLGRDALVRGTGAAAPAMMAHKSAIDVAVPVPTLMTRPPARSNERANASMTSSIYTKSRVCFPLPCTIGARPWDKASTKAATTPSSER